MSGRIFITVAGLAQCSSSSTTPASGRANSSLLSSSYVSSLPCFIGSSTWEPTGATGFLSDICNSKVIMMALVRMGVAKVGCAIYASQIMKNKLAPLHQLSLSTDLLDSIMYSVWSLSGKLAFWGQAICHCLFSIFTEYQFYADIVTDIREITVTMTDKFLFLWSLPSAGVVANEYIKCHVIANLSVS